MVDVAVGQQDLLDRHACLGGGRLERGRSPPGSVKAPRIVFVHHSRVQFCCSGVTGMMAALRGGVARSFGRLAVAGSTARLPATAVRPSSSGDSSRPGAGPGGCCRRRAWRDSRRSSRGGSARRTGADSPRRRRGPRACRECRRSRRRGRHGRGRRLWRHARYGRRRSRCRFRARVRRFPRLQPGLDLGLAGE